ncbi:MAG: hydantoinase B/oxoprolinase family protein [Planctomycetes bacterium]|nr:hydantoinase B/oxoprolinase family protein [Planctomycetota bacterium]
MKIDPVTTQVLRFRMESIADEMGYTLVRTSRSTVIKEIEDISCAVFDRRGRTIAQGHHAPMLLTGFEFTMAALLERVKDWSEGDVVLSNDPYLGGQHLTDLQTFSPVFHKGKIAGFVGNIAHHSDVGGSAPGTVTGGLTEIYQEGLRLPMVKLYVAGKENPDIFGILRANIRVPDKTLGDLRAQAAAGFVGVRRFKEALDRYGVETVEAATEALMGHSERRLRAALAEIPDGTYSGEDYVDDDGITDAPIRICVNVRKKGDGATIDFTGTSPQVTGNLNCPIATTHAAVYYALIAVLDPRVPPNSGCYRPFKVEAEPGLAVNPRPPGAVQARTNTSQKVSEATLRALAHALPDKVTAGSHGNIMTNAFSGWYAGTRKRYVCIEIQGGGAGARPTKDGCDGQDSHLARFMNTPTEAQELEYPLRVERYEFIPDTGGAGKFRGALALRRDIRALADMTFSRYADRQKFPPFGVLGGKDGACGETRINGEKARAKGIDRLKAGDVVSLRTPGAGGYGDPKERDPELVKRDVRDGKVTPAAARRDYGVQP